MTLRLRQTVSARLPILALLAGTLVWGTIWYPYRALTASGIGPLTGSMLTYAVALLLAMRVFGWRAWVRPDIELVALAVSAGVTNVGFIWATNSGVILRVLLLFYLMPVWTVGWTYLLLGLRPNLRNLFLTAIALTGAALMLWQPGMAFPVPANGAEWAAVAAGMAFALSNVLIHRMTRHSAQNKSLWILVGCTALGALGALAETGRPFALHADTLLLILVLGVVLCAINLVVQHGVERIAPERVPLVYLFELVIAAGSAWLLVGEPVTLQEVAGGLLIIVASAMTPRVGTPRPLDGLTTMRQTPPDRSAFAAETTARDAQQSRS